MMRRRYPLVLRLARIDSELASAAKMIDLLADDLLDGAFAVHDAEARVFLLVAMSGALLLASGIEPRLVHAWMTDMGPGGEVEDADRLGTQIVEQMMLIHGPTQGEG
jgi:hypothetical protein